MTPIDADPIADAVDRAVAQYDAAFRASDAALSAAGIASAHGSLAERVARLAADRDAAVAEVVAMRAALVSAERDRVALISLRNHILSDPAAKEAIAAYVCSRWDAAGLSEGMASFLLGVDRLTAREIRDARPDEMGLEACGCDDGLCMKHGTGAEGEVRDGW